MKTLIKRFITGVVITIFASAMNACSPLVVETRAPRPVHVVSAPPPQPVYASVIPPPPVQTVVVQPVIPVWAPPYTYVTEVHYYYFPDYMMYYDIFAQHYVYFDGFSWVNVTVLPSIPVFMGFSPYNSYIVVMDRHCDRPWYRHTYYEAQYPQGYYKTAYAPRHSLGSNTVLRAYDENQSKPLFVDRRTNREVAVKYDVVQSPRGTAVNPSVRSNPVSESPRNNSVVQNPRNDVSQGAQIRNNSATESPRNNSVVQNPRINTIQNTDVRNNSVSESRGNSQVIQNSQSNNNPRGQVKNNSETTISGSNNVSESPRKNNVTGMPDRAFTNGNAAPSRNVRQPVLSTQPVTAPQVKTESAQPKRATLERTDIPSSRVSNSSERNIQPVAAPQQNSSRQKEQRKR